MPDRRMCSEDELILQACRQRPDAGVLRGLIETRVVGWDSLVRTARRHRVAPLVLERLLALPLRSSARSSLQEVGRREIASVIHDNAVFRSELAVLLRALRARGIEPLLLKGLSLNFSGLRCMGDIDLMVPRPLVAEAVDAVLAVDGYRYRPMRRAGPDFADSLSGGLPEPEKRRVRSQLSWNNEFQLAHPARGVLLELHHAPFWIRNRAGSFVEDLGGLVRNTAVFWHGMRRDPSLDCSVLSPAHALLLSCLRNAVKQQPANNGFRLANLVDIDNLVAAGIAWEELLRDCLLLRLAPAVLFSLALARDLLETPVPPPVLRDLRAACTPGQRGALRIHRRCVASLGPSSPLHSTRYKAVSPWVFGGTLRQRLAWLFLVPLWLPSRSRMAMFSGLPRDSAWILGAYLANPVRWAWRLLGRGGMGRAAERRT